LQHVAIPTKQTSSSLACRFALRQHNARCRAPDVCDVLLCPEDAEARAYHETKKELVGREASIRFCGAWELSPWRRLARSPSTAMRLRQ